MICKFVFSYYAFRKETIVMMVQYVVLRLCLTIIISIEVCISTVFHNKVREIFEAAFFLFQNCPSWERGEELFLEMRVND